jgi:uncharacterized metal-binding protein
MSRGADNQLTDNYVANMYMLPVAGFLLYLIDLNTNRMDHLLMDMIPFIVIYIYSSRFFNPDLDGDNRPGKTTFPFGKRVFKLAAKSRFLIWLTYIQIVFSFIWNWFWYPYSCLFTHRGVSHLPIASAALRGVYLYVALLFLSRTSSELETLLSPINYWLRHFLLLDKDNSVYFTTYCLPVYVSDLFHTVIDFYDSFKAGKRFNSTPSEHHGILAKIWRKIRRK